MKQAFTCLFLLVLALGANTEASRPRPSLPIWGKGTKATTAFKQSTTHVRGDRSLRIQQRGEHQRQGSNSLTPREEIVRQSAHLLRV